LRGESHGFNVRVGAALSTAGFALIAAQTLRAMFSERTRVGNF